MSAPQDELVPGLGSTCLKDKAAIRSVEVVGFYDGVAYYQCPSCGQVWGRDGRPRTSARDVPHPVRRLFTVGDYFDQEAERLKAAKP